MPIAQFAEDGLFEPRKIAAVLRTSSEEVAMTVGLGKDAVQRRARIRSDKTQRRLRELVEVLNKVQPRFGSDLMAYAWFRSEPLAGFDGRTAMTLVQDGKAQQVLDYIDALDAGVYA
ncbi:MbcA/ParS/Xre antitoxin family protein [Chachezhania sediminis]|uniref:MbcA/ParS/Xre antitoxin family protein n=1 Tax=Chachezhania sediminis TaxID=2599291 RepID=UPI00131DCA62|nr:MbcA/ParS/Xre antitoxin family protein [Chachezhania sediminis]